LESENNTPSEHQLLAFREATRNAVGILIGAPGTGKTWLIARIIESLSATQKVIAIAAPTNKAANRITETLKQQGVEATAATIHGILGAQIDNRGKFKFYYNSNNRLSVDYIIIDESSMIDGSLLYSLLEATPDHANVLFVGDCDQLSPVGRGAPLRDMIAAVVPCGKLSEIRRNAGSIVKACHAIKNNETFDCHTQDIEDESSNLVMLNFNAKNPLPTIQKILNYENEKDNNFNRLNDAQLIVATNDKSAVSRKQLNAEMVKWLNYKPDRDEKQNRFFEGDKVICLANGSTVTDKNKPIRVANGDIGYIEHSMKETYCVDINGTLVIVPKHSDQWGIYDFDLGYTITAHKSQGSQWKVVIIALDSSFAGNMVCDRHWIYTAISRAERRCYVLGSVEQIQHMTRKSNMWNRKTTLVEQFNERKFKNINTQFKEFCDGKKSIDE
jgi:exodeoxyribonuclease V alpha subunit